MAPKKTAKKKAPAKKAPGKSKGKFQKGRKKTGGRGKGIKNKLSRDVVKKVLDTVELLEAEDKSLYDVASKDQTSLEWFYQHIFKADIPKDVRLEVDPTQNAIKFAQMALRNSRNGRTSKK